MYLPAHELHWQWNAMQLSRSICKAHVQAMSPLVTMDMINTAIVDLKNLYANFGDIQEAADEDNSGGAL